MLANRHLELVDQGGDDSGCVWLRARTVQSQITVAVAARCRIGDEAPRWSSTDTCTAGSPDARVSVAVAAGTCTTLEKVVAIFTSKDRAISEPGLAARQAVVGAGSFDDLLVRHRAAWEPLWRRATLAVNDEDGSGSVLNLHLFHLLQVASPHVIDFDAGFGARGLHGEGYRGHVFWDTSFAFPVVNLRFPAVSVLSWRIEAAPARGSPCRRRRWLSRSHVSVAERQRRTGRVANGLFDPRSGRWMPDRSRFERHVGLAIAYDAWQHWQATGDFEFVAGPGAGSWFLRSRGSLPAWRFGTTRSAAIASPESSDPNVSTTATRGRRIRESVTTHTRTSWRPGCCGVPASWPRCSMRNIGRRRRTRCGRTGDRSMGGDLAGPARTVPRRGHTPIRRLRPTRGSRSRSLSQSLRQHRAPRPTPRLKAMPSVVTRWASRPMF